MEYHPKLVPYSLATADVFQNKTDKSKGFHYLIKNVMNSQVPSMKTILVTKDGNAIFQYLRLS